MYPQILWPVRGLNAKQQTRHRRQKPTVQAPQSKKSTKAIFSSISRNYTTHAQIKKDEFLQKFNYLDRILGAAAVAVTPTLSLSFPP